MKLLKSFYKWLVNVEKDKLLHFIVIFIITLIIYGIVVRITNSKISAIGISWFASLLIGVSKEVYDEYKYHNAEEGDLVADAIGFATGLIIALGLTL